MKLTRHFTALAAATALSWASLAGSASAQDPAAPAPAPVAAALAEPAPAAAAAPEEAAPPTTEQRIADLEAYVKNTQPGKDGDKTWKSNIAGPGPGHNAWQMTSTALVIFMTLPGLALFYGGLVRRKNVLSVLAQCLGIAGMVTIIWWACGYSLSFGVDAKSPFFGDFSNAMFKGLEPGNSGAGYYWISDVMWSMFQIGRAHV